MQPLHDRHIKNTSEPVYDALVVLGSVMEWSLSRNRWEFPTIIERYSGKLAMGKARALAAKELEKDARIVLVTGGTETHPITGERSSRSFELSRLMVNELGMPEEKVIPMGQAQSSHTLGNAADVAQYLVEHSEVLHTRTIAILCPAFQVERAQFIFNQHSFFKDHNIMLEWIIVEDVLGNKDPMYKKWRKTVYATHAAKINREMEAAGIKALKEGIYKPKS